MKPSPFRCLSRALPLLFLSVLPLRAAVYIDTFETEQHVRIGGKKDKDRASSAKADEALGGQRDVEIYGSSKKSPLEASVGGEVDGFFTFNADSSARGTARITWDGFDQPRRISRTGLGSFDLTQGGLNEQFLFSIASDGRARVTIRVYESSARYSEACLVIPGSSGGLQEYSIKFGDFVDRHSRGAHFDSVGAITFEVTALQPGADIALDFLAVTPLLVPIPEAGTWIAGVAVAVLAGIMCFRPKR